MEYNLSIRQDNVEAYLDIEKDIATKKDGLFTFIIRVNNGKICDYNVLEYINARLKYFRLKEITTTEYVILHNSNGGTKNTTIRPDDSELHD